MKTSNHILTLLAALALTACGSESADEPLVTPGKEVSVLPVERQVPVLFGGAPDADEAGTRANPDYAVNNQLSFPAGGQNITIPIGKHVGVFGYNQGTDPWHAAMSTDFFNNQRMEVVAAPSELTASNPDLVYLSYSPLRYWPIGDENMLGFYAYYPYTTQTYDKTTFDTLTAANFNSDDTNNGIYLDTGTGIGKYHFISKTSSEKQIDFMISDLNYDVTRSQIYTNESDKRVPLKFRHMLAAIDIFVDISGHDDYAGVESIKMTGIKMKGICEPKHREDLYAAGALWHDQSDYQTVTMDGLPIDGSLTEKEDLTTDPAHKKYGLKTSQRFLLIPQDLIGAADGSKPQTGFEIVLKKKVYGDSEEPTKVTGYENVTFTPTRDGEWKAGNKYRYEFFLKKSGDLDLIYQEFKGNAGKAEKQGEIN